MIHIVGFITYTDNEKDVSESSSRFLF